MGSLVLVDVAKVALALAGAALALGWTRLPPRRRRLALACLVAVASLNYLRWTPSTLTRDVDAYDLLHYYLGAKYAPELQWADLYPALLEADQESGGPWFPDEGDQFFARTPAGFRVESIDEGRARGREVRDARFTPERWSAFVHDFSWLQRTSTPGLVAGSWRELIQDHGFNGTPVWTLVAEPLAAALPVEQVKALGWLDGGLIAASIAGIAWTYGGDAALWAWLWCAVTFSMRWPTVTWAFLRYDWLACLVAALCLAKKGRPLLAGIFAGYAAAVRLVPLFWLWGALRRRALAGVLAAAVVFCGANAAATAWFGPSAVESWARSAAAQETAPQLSSRAVGLAIAFTWNGSSEPPKLDPDRREAIASSTLARLALAAAFLVVVGSRLGALPDDEAFAYGFLAFFLLATAEYYYGCARLLLAVVHAANLDRGRHRIALAWLLGIEAASNLARASDPGSLALLTGIISWSTCAYALGIALHVWVPERARAQ